MSRSQGAVAPRSVTVLGATGSIGRQTLDLLRRHPERFQVEALAAGRDVEGLAAAAIAVGARFAAVADPTCGAALRERLAGTGIACGAGPDAVIEAAARPAEWVMAAVVGAAGLQPVMTALRRGVTVALANKECLVAAGSLMTAAAAAHGATLLPVDSEHNAIFQVLDAARPEAVEKLILTASGGPFRQWPAAKLATATPEQAVAHPNWSMGAKISVDSASLMNKGLELIEAARLFDMPEERIDVLVHPQSVIHSLVAYIDGSVLAQLGAPDMRIPIAYCLAWPERMPTPAARLDLAAIARLEFEPPDDTRFPALGLARAALRQGGAATAILSAANEEAVAAFLARRIGFLDIPAVAAATMDSLGAPPTPDLDAVLHWDATARRTAAHHIARRSAASA